MGFPDLPQKKGRCLGGTPLAENRLAYFFLLNKHVLGVESWKNWYYLVTCFFLFVVVCFVCFFLHAKKDEGLVPSPVFG